MVASNLTFRLLTVTETKSSVLENTCVEGHKCVNLQILDQLTTVKIKRHRQLCRQTLPEQFIT
jgi:hypothetical protein